MPELRTLVDTGSDGALTEEAGVISGRLDLRTDVAADGVLTLAVAYQGAEEWYTLAGSGRRLHDVQDHAVVHDLLVTVLGRPAAT